MIVSISRRTDIPARYCEWLMRRLNEGFAYTRNPMRHSQLSRVSLRTPECECIVLWTKDIRPLIPRLAKLDGYGIPYCVQHTLTPYGMDMEPGIADKPAIIEGLLALSAHIKPARIMLRYDPIILTHKYTPTFHIRAFERVCELLAGSVSGCTISFYDAYAKLDKRMANAGLISPSASELYSLSAALAEIARSYNLKLQTCCESIDLTPLGICKGACISPALVTAAVAKPLVSSRRDQSQRKGCNCLPSVDIGAYNSCLNLCTYCYANWSQESVRKNCKSHVPDSPLLIGVTSPDEVVSERTLSKSFFH